jgi:hypothetical protein
MTTSVGEIEERCLTFCLQIADYSLELSSGCFSRSEFDLEMKHTTGLGQDNLLLVTIDCFL